MVVINDTGVSGIMEPSISLFNASYNVTPTPYVTRMPTGHEDSMWAHNLRYICEAWISLPVAVLGVLGNLLAFVVLCSQKQKTTTTVLLRALAVADTLVLICSMVIRSFRFVIPDYDKGLPYMYMFRWMYPSVFVVRLANTWLTVLLTVDRYIAVCHPLHAQRLCTFTRTYVLMIMVTLTALLVSLPRFFEYELFERNGRSGIRNGALVSKNGYIWAYRFAFYLVIMYLIPMILMIVLNACLLSTLLTTATLRSSLQAKRIYSKSVRSRQSDQSETSNQGDDTSLMQVSNGIRRSNRSITQIVAVVVLVALLCNIAGMLTHILHALVQGRTQFKHLDAARRVLINISNVMITFNSAINFVIYCVCSRNFRSVITRSSVVNKIVCQCKKALPGQRNVEPKMGNLPSGSSSYMQVNRIQWRSSQRRGTQDIRLQNLKDGESVMRNILTNDTKASC